MDPLTIWAAELEVRQAGTARRLTGKFPYGKLATVASRGKVRKERIEPRAFEYVVTGPGKNRDVNLLAGHQFGMPLASRKAKTLELRESDAELAFEADLPSERTAPSWINDAVRAIFAGLMTGVSPGFQVPPGSVVPGAESLIPEPGNPDVLIRSIRQAVLYELSVVTRPAYTAASVELGKREIPVPRPRQPGLERLAWL